MERSCLKEKKTFTNKGCKITTRKLVLFWEEFCLTEQDFFFCFSLHLSSLLAPISRSPMSKTIRFWDSFGKSNGKKWSQIWKLLLNKGVKLLWRKKFFLRIFFICSLRLNIFLPPLLKVQFPNFLDFPNSLEKVMEGRGLGYKTFAHRGCKVACVRRNFAFLAGFFLYRCYSPHWSRESLSPVCGIFTKLPQPPRHPVIRKLIF